jgi:hypothetical protein
MLQPLGRIDHSADWPARLRTGRYFSYPSTGRGPVSRHGHSVLDWSTSLLTGHSHWATRCQSVNWSIDWEANWRILPAE